MAESFFNYVRQDDRGLVITSARRSHLEQARLYALAQAGRNNGLPAMPPGTSDHEYGLAFDMAHPGIDPFTDGALWAAGATWVRWGGRWSARDPVHFAAPLRSPDNTPTLQLRRRWRLRRGRRLSSRRRPRAR